MVMRFFINPLLVRLEVKRGNFDPLLLVESKLDEASSEVEQSDVSSPLNEISTFVPNDEGQLREEYDIEKDLVRSEFSGSYYLAKLPRCSE